MVKAQDAAGFARPVVVAQAVAVAVVAAGARAVVATVVAATEATREMHLLAAAAAVEAAVGTVAAVAVSPLPVLVQGLVQALVLAKRKHARQARKAHVPKHGATVGLPCRVVCLPNAEAAFNQLPM